MASEVAAAAVNVVRRAGKEMHGVVVSAGLMDKTVKVKLGGLRWEPRVQKFFKAPRFRLVHDPANSVRQGDIVAIEPSWRVSQHVRHVVKDIIAPYGAPIEQRPPVPTLEARVVERAAKRAARDERRALRREEQARNAAEEREALLEEKRKRLEERERLKGTETTLSDVD
ncbi:nucleic acid-binding protein [Daldinia grandis]|nr:nucleic acid-binding protein [Daldinia grandis]